MRIRNMYRTVRPLSYTLVHIYVHGPSAERLIPVDLSL